MGCGASKVGYENFRKNSNLESVDVRSSTTKLTFSQQQLSKLNLKFLTLLENNTEAAKEKQTTRLGVVVERLIQRLICNIGYLDSRFTSKFLINLEPLKDYNPQPKTTLKYKYLVRLDVISTPALYPEIFEPPVRIIEGTKDKPLPQGYAKIKVHGEFLEQWAGFLSFNGFLRRDKVQKRFLELLAKAAAHPTEPFSPTEVDESRHCGCPGKVVDPVTLSHILGIPAGQQVFFGSDESSELRFPDPRDFRIAIVEGTPETRLHISFLSSVAQSYVSEDLEISLTLGVGVSGWPTQTNYPSRLPLDHIDILLGYKAAQLNYYLVPKGPHSSIYCEDKSSLWEIRVIPTEMFLMHHYTPTSVVAKINKILIILLQILKARGVKTIHKYIMKNLFFYELENKNQIQHWKPKTIAKRVISILGQLLIYLESQFVPSYFFPENNILLQDGAFDDDYASDRDILENFLQYLNNDEFNVGVNEGDLVKFELENVLLKKWDNVIAGMLPPKSNKSHRLNVVHNSPIAISYTRQQIEYITALIQEILTLKKIQESKLKNNIENNRQKMTKKENFLYLLQLMFDQAKEKLLTSKRRKTSRKKLCKLDQLTLSYDLSTAMLMDDIRRNGTDEYDVKDDFSVVTKVLECLYKAMDLDEKLLGPVLRPYLHEIFKGSHENCWFLPEWNKKSDLSEFKAIGAFCELLLQDADPLEVILSSYGKGWNWAVHCVQTMKEIAEENSRRIITGEKLDFTESGVRLILAPHPGKTIVLNVSLTKPLTLANKKISKSTTDLTYEKRTVDSRYATIKSYQDVLETKLLSIDTKALRGFSSFGLKNEKQPMYIRLKESNPMTVASMGTRRQGNHRGLGSIIQALISLQKLTVLQEISQFLPVNEKNKVLSDIKKLSKEIHRVSVENYKKSKNVLPQEKQRTIFKNKTSKTLPSRIISTKPMHLSLRFKNLEPSMSGIYKSMDEFPVVYNQEQNKLPELTKTEDSLKEINKKLSKFSKSTIGATPTQSKIGANSRQSTMSFNTQTLNTPFYIKVASSGNKIKKEKEYDFNNTDEKTHL